MTRALLVLIIFSLPICAKSDVILTARCAQDIADYKHGGNQGLVFASELLTQLTNAPGESQALLKKCQDYVSTNPKTSDSRRYQLDFLRKLKDKTPSHVYFFLRSVIRPLIVCEKDPNPLHRTCHSTTGKNWYETGFHPRAKEKEFLYRLGHSETPGGILVLGPQDEFTEEDREFIHSLPLSFTRDALYDLEEELNTKSYRMKIFMLERSTYFMEHYFEGP